MLLVEDVLGPILPVGESLHVGRLSKDGLALILERHENSLLGLNSMTLKGRASGGCQGHLVGVDNLSLFLEVKSVTVFNHLSLLQLVFVLLLLNCAHSFRIRVSHKFIGAPSLSATGVSSNSGICNGKCIEGCVLFVRLLDTHSSVS